MLNTICPVERPLWKEVLLTGLHLQIFPDFGCDATIRANNGEMREVVDLRQNPCSRVILRVRKGGRVEAMLYA